MQSRPRPPAGARNWVLLVLDSCRHDSLVAGADNLARLGTIHRRWSYATWTAPSHYSLLMGLLPHPSPPHTWAAQVYADGFAAMATRLGVELDWRSMAPGLWMPEWLQSQGWVTGAWVSLPVLNATTPLRRGFDRYALREHHADLRGIIDDLRFYNDRPSFWLINAGETHYPYAPRGSNLPPLPHLAGVHGAVKRGATGLPEALFSADELAALHQRQIDAVRHVDALLPRLAALAPDDTWLTVTADHGECFGEDGYFGHGPIHHPAVLEVPLVEGPLATLR